MMNIAVYGAGAMGTALGAFLYRAGFAADLVSRDAAHIAVLKTDGAKIGGTVSFSTPPFDGQEGRGRALLPAEMSKKYDVIFLLTKQTDNAASAEMLKNFLAPTGIVCTMQNGIPEPGLTAVLGTDRVLGCICIWGASKTAPGVVELTSKPGSMRFMLSSPGDVQIMLEKICPTSVEANFIGARWSKLLLNAAFSGLSAVTGLSFGEIAADRSLRSDALDIVKECVEVCYAAGIEIEPVQGKFPARFLYFKNHLHKIILSIIMPIAMRNHRAIKSSMLRDLALKRECDIEAINGAVCRAGREHNVPTPYNDRIVSMVHTLERL